MTRMRCRHGLPLAAALLLAPGTAGAACPTVPEVARLAGAILDRRAPPPPFGPLTEAEAICARDRLVAVLAQPWGDRVGWKILAVEGRPLSGALFHGTLREAGAATLPAAYGIRPMVGAGLLLRIRDDGIEAAGGAPLALLRHVEAVAPFLDLTDEVHGAEAARMPALRLALNLGTRLGVVGAPIPVEPTEAFARALGAARLTLSSGGDAAETGMAAAPQGDPLAALAWLARDLREQGRTLRAGEWVAVAGLLPPRPAEPGRDYVLRLSGLGAAPSEARAMLR